MAKPASAARRRPARPAIGIDIVRPSALFGVAELQLATRIRGIPFAGMLLRAPLHLLLAYGAGRPSLVPKMGLFDAFADAFANEDLSEPQRPSVSAPVDLAALVDSSLMCDLSVTGIPTNPDPSSDLYGPRTSITGKAPLQCVDASVDLQLLDGGEATVTDSELTRAFPPARWWVVDGGELQVQLATAGIKLTSSWKVDTGRLESLGSSSYVVPAGSLFLRGKLDRFGTRLRVRDGEVFVRVEKSRFNTYMKGAGKWSGSGEIGSALRG